LSQLFFDHVFVSVHPSSPWLPTRKQQWQEVKGLPGVYHSEFSFQVTLLYLDTITHPLFPAFVVSRPSHSILTIHTMLGSLTSISVHSTTHRIPPNPPRQHPHRALPHRAPCRVLRLGGRRPRLPRPHDGCMGILRQLQPNALRAPRPHTKLPLLRRNPQPRSGAGAQRPREQPQLEPGLALSCQDYG
jgi:hypothetical protein